MSDRKPLVSVGMPVYNEAQWIRHSLDALLDQTFEDFELIVSDNASTDGTWAILQEYAARDSRIVLYRQSENRGFENWLDVLDQADGDYFMWAAGHDLWSPNLLEVLVSGMQANPDVVLCVPQAVLIDEDGRLLKSYGEAIDTRSAASPAERVLTMHRQLQRCNAFYGLHRRRVLRRTLPWPKVVGNDFVILVRIASLGNIITDQSARWFRRRNRQETHQERIQRYVSVHNIKGLAAEFPYLVGRIATIVEYSRAKGPYRERIALLRYGIKKLFMESSQRRLLIKELLEGSSALIRYP